MINKIKNGTDFYKCLWYILRESSKYPGSSLKEKMVHYISSREVNIPFDKELRLIFKAKDISQEFSLQAKMNPRIKKCVKHVVLSWKEEDYNLLRELQTKGQLEAAIIEYLNRQGWENCQYIAFLHRDKNNPHIHIVINMVDRYGKRLKDNNDFVKGSQICKELNKKYGFTMGSRKEFGVTSIKDITDPKEQARYRVAILVEKGLSSPGIYSFADLQRYLNDNDVEMAYKDAVTESGRTIISGVKFHFEAFWFWGSYLSREMSAGAIAKRLAEKRKQAQEEYNKKKEEESREMSSVESNGTKINIAPGKTTRSNVDASKNSGELEHHGIKI